MYVCVCVYMNTRTVCIMLSFSARVFILFRFGILFIFECIVSSSFSSLSGIDFSS